MTRVVFDWYCGAGGAGKGFQDSGFDVVIGVDIAPQPHYPFQFVQGNALALLRHLLSGGSVAGYTLADIDAHHASPPCQAFTKSQRIRGNNHPDLIALTRARLLRAGKPFVIENVPGAPLHHYVTLCGAMFPPLRVYRHRLFEVHGFVLPQPPHVPHIAPQVRMGRPPAPNEWSQPVGHFSGVKRAQRDMGIDWMGQHELAESIPPAFTEYVGRFMLAQIEGVKA